MKTLTAIIEELKSIINKETITTNDIYKIQGLSNAYISIETEAEFCESASDIADKVNQALSRILQKAKNDTPLRCP